MYNDNSVAEGGTLCQLKCLINRTNVPAKLTHNVNAAEEFIHVVVTSHFIAAALHHFKMDSVEDLPSSAELDQIHSPDSQKKLFHTSLIGMVKHLTSLHLAVMTNKDEDQVRAYA